MPAIVELSGGRTVEFPDAASPTQIEEALRRDYPAEFGHSIEIAPGDLGINPAANQAVDLQATTRGGPPVVVPEGALGTTLGELASGISEGLNIPRNLGGGLGFAGDVTRAGVADIASNVGGTEFAGNVPAVFMGEPLPVDQALADASEEQSRQGGFPWATVLGHTSQGMAKLAPKLVAAGVTGGSTLLGQSLAAGGLFGLDDEGNFHPKEAAFAALFPVVGAAGRMAAASVLSKAALAGSKLAVNPTTQKAVELAADNAAQFAYATATQAPELIKLSQENPQAFQQSLGELIAMQLGFSLLGLRHLRGETPSDTQKWIEKRGQEMAVKLATDQKYADSIDAAVVAAMNPKNAQRQVEPRGDNAEVFRAAEDAFSAPPVPVPEPPATLAAQVEATLNPDTPKAVTLVTPGAESPKPQGLVSVATAMGEALVNPLKISPAEAKAILDRGQGGKLLGMSTDVKPEDGNAVLETRTPEGVPVQQEVIAPQTEIPVAAAAGKAVAPDGVQEIKSAAQVIAERQSRNTETARETPPKNVPGADAPTASAPEQSPAVIEAATRKAMENAPEGKIAAPPKPFETMTPDEQSAYLRGLKRPPQVGGVGRTQAEVTLNVNEQILKAGRWPNGKLVTGADKKRLQGENRALRAVLAQLDEQSSKPVETPAAAAEKVQEHVADVASGDKAVKVEGPKSKVQSGPRPAKEIKSELVERLAAAIEKAPFQDKTDYARLQKVLADPPEQHFKSVNDVNMGAGYMDRYRAEYERAVALSKTKKSAPQKITIEIPGDGTFTVFNTKETLGQVLKRAQALDTSSGKAPKKFPPGKSLGLAVEAIRVYGDARKAIQKLREQAENPDVEMTPDQRSEMVATAADMEVRLPENVAAARMSQWRAELATVTKQFEAATAKLVEFKAEADAQRRIRDDRLAAQRPITSITSRLNAAERAVDRVRVDVNQSKQAVGAANERIARAQALIDQAPPPRASRGAVGFPLEPRGDFTPEQRRELLRQSEPVNIPIDPTETPKTPGFVERLKDIYRKFRPATNALDGHEIQFVMTGFRKLNSHRADQRTLQLVPQLPELVKRAVPLYAESDRTGNAQTQWHVYGARAVIGGEPVMVKLVVREEAKGKFTLDYFDDGSVTAEDLFIKQNGQLADPLSMQGQAARSLDRDKLFQWWHGVKSDAPPPSTGGIGFPMAAPVPPTPPPAPGPGATMIQNGRLPVTLDRTAPGSVSVPQIMDSMTRVLRAAGSDAGNIRPGRFLQKALGIWKPHEEIIRLESADSIPTATHEIGHGLQQKIYGTALAHGLKFFGPDIRRELIGMGKALYGNRKPVAGYTGEGFAEFMRYWLTTEDAGRVAPKLTKFFEQQFLPAHPEVARALTDARDLVTIWRHQGSVERANRQVVREPGTFKRVAEALAKFVGYQAQFESGAPIEAITKAAAKKLGRSLAPSEDPFKLFSWKRGTAGATVERMATEHMLDVWGNPVGPSLAEALAPVKGKRNEFLLYVFAQAAEMRWKQDKNPGIALADARHIKALYDSPEFRLAADKYRKWNDQLLDYVVQADPAMADAVKAMRGANDYYAPLARMIDPVKAKRAAAQSQGNSMMRMFGSGLPVKDIFDQTFINAARMVNRANRALVTRAIIKLSQVQGLGHIVEEVPRDRIAERFSVEQIRKQLEDMGVDTTMIPQDEVLQYYSLADVPKGSDPIVAHKDAAGKTRWYQVDPRLYEQLEGLQTYSLKQAFPGVPYLGTMLDLVLGVPSRAFRLGTTGLRPAFSLVTNPLRDVATLLAQSASNPAKVAALYPAALMEAVKGGQYKDAFFDLGAHLGQPLGTDIGHTQRVSKELFHGRVMRVVTNPVDHLRELLSITESAPRIAELRAVAEDIGWTPGTPLSPDQAVQLALAAKRVTVDFSAAGDVSRILNQSIPFYNPALQGMRSFARAFKNSPSKAALMGLALFTGPALALWWKNKDKEWYRALPWRERYLYSHIDDGKNVWQIPRPFEWGNVFAVIPEALFDSWYHHDKTAATEAFAHIFESTNPADLPVLAKLAKEQWRNRIDFWDRPIVPRSEVDLPASEQFGPYTSQLAVGINKAFPELSPRRVDAAVRGYFGGTATDVLQLLGVGSQKQDREWEAADFPVFGTIFRRGGEFNAQNQHITDFWETYLPSRGRVDGFNFAKNQADQGLRKPETVKPPSPGDFAIARIGEDAGKAIRVFTMLAARTKETKARAELYRQAGQIAEQAATAMKNAEGMK